MDVNRRVTAQEGFLRLHFVLGSIFLLGLFGNFVLFFLLQPLYNSLKMSGSWPQLALDISSGGTLEVWRLESRQDQP